MTKKNKAKVKCGTCGKYEEQNISDANYQVVFYNRYICSGCLDKEHKELFYGTGT